MSLIRFPAGVGANIGGPWNPNANSLSNGTGTDRLAYWANQDGSADFGAVTQSGNTGGIIEIGVGDTLTFTATGFHDPVDLDSLLLFLSVG